MYNIILVDDEKTIIDGLRIILQRILPECRIVAVAYDAEEGVGKIKELKPDIVITDIKLLNEDGLSMVERLRKSGVDSKYIILSAYQEFKFAKKGMELGVKYYLTKPVDDDELQKCVRSVIEEIKQESGPGSERISEVVDSSDKRDVVYRIKMYLEEHFRETISLGDLSRKFNINMYYLSQLFKEKTGQNYTDYLSQLRVNLAKDLLRRTDMKVYEVCAEVGYTDSTYFAKLFERIVGSTPTEYRKHMAGSRGQ